MEKTSIFEKAKKIFSEGGVVAIPTETVYGLAAPINNEQGLRSIFSLKERPFFDPLIVHISSTKQIPLVASDWPEIADRLAKKFWPGPLTIILPKKPELHSLISSGLPTVGVRMPNHPLALDLIQYVGVPLAAPSANKFGKTSPTTVAHVLKNFPDVFVVDGGDSEIGIESTVVEIRKNEISILRPGMISEKNLKEALRGITISFAKNSISSPGHTKDHYQPQKPLYIIGNGKEWQELQEIYEGKNMGELSLGDNPVFAARTLYAQLHRMDADPEIRAIYVFREEKNSSADWLAIWDRLERARKK